MYFAPRGALVRESATEPLETRRQKGLTTLKEAMRRTGPIAVSGREGSRRAKNRAHERCSICKDRLKSNAVPLTEPEGATEPRRSWILCNDCYQALLVEMRRSPVRSPLRLRIAMGLVAAERWPESYSPPPHTKMSDRQWILVIAWGFVIAMLIHLALIVMIAMVAR